MNNAAGYLLDDPGRSAMIIMLFVMTSALLPPHSYWLRANMPLGRDPAMLWNVGSRAVTKGAAATGKMGRFETELPAQMGSVRCLGWAPTPALWRAWASCTGSGHHKPASAV